MARSSDDQDAMYASLVDSYGGALRRLASAYERDPSLRADLLQDIHFALWRSLALYDERCSLRTWMYRVAHNTAITHTDRQSRKKHESIGDLPDLDRLASDQSVEDDTVKSEALARLMTMIHQLKMPDRQIITLYLEDLDAATIGDVMGLTAGAVATRIHRIKEKIVGQFKMKARQS